MNMLQRLQKNVSAKAISMLLVVAMLFGALPANTVLVANAAAPSVKAKIYFLNADGWGTPAMNAWSDSEVTITGNGTASGNANWVQEQGKPLLAIEDEAKTDGWYYATVDCAMAISGIQLLNADDAYALKLNDTQLASVNSCTSEEYEAVYICRNEVFESKEAAEAWANAKCVSPVYEEDGTVTFNLKTSAESAALKGAFTSWETVPMNQVEAAVTGYEGFTVNYAVPTDGGLYEYGMVTGEGNVWEGDPANLSKKGNAVVVRNPKVDNGTVSIYYPSAEEGFNGKVLYRKAGTAGEYAEKEFTALDGATNLYVASITDAEANVKYEYLVQIGENEPTYDAYNFASREVTAEATVTTFTATKAIEKPDFTSPVINEDGSVTFNYWAPSAATVQLAGDMTNWEKYPIDMTKNEENGLFSVTVNLDPGPYGYKFVVDGAWITDPENEEKNQYGNSLVTVPVPDSDLKSPVINEDGTVTFNYRPKEGQDVQVVKLAGTMTSWAGKAITMTKDEETGVFSHTMELKPGSYQYKYIVDGAWMTDPLNGEYESGNSLVKVPGLTLTAANIAGVGPIEVSAEIPDDGEITAEELVWSIADVDEEEPVTGLTIAADPADNTKAYVSASNDSPNGFFKVVVTYGDNKTSELQLYHTQKAYLYEYTYKEDSPHTGQSDIYVWYNSQAGNVGYPLKEVNGSNIAYITLDDTTSNFGYIARLDGKWGASASEDREFDDRTLYVNMDDRYTKVKGGEGILDPYLLPSGKTSYDNGIKFAYRDDELFYNNAMDTLKDETVNVCYKLEDADEYIVAPMTYSEEDELFTYYVPAKELEEGTYDFYFEVAGDRVEDIYWKDGKIEFKKPELTVVPTVSPEAVNYDMNPVVSFDISTTDDSISGEFISAITADLSELGYPGAVVDFSATSKSGVLYIERNVEPGTYNVPCTITDAWGNTTEVNVPVTVVERTDASPSWDESNIYFLLTDRFVDGDTSNNYDVNKDKIEAYHGGDFKGLTSKLSYLQNLGVNTIWITPIVDNIEDVMNPDLHQQAYHGYWAKDFTKVDEHLGNTEDLDNLIDEAAKRGIKVMVDIVVNHAGYNTKKNENFKGMLRTDEELVPGDVILDELDHLPDFKTEEADVRAQLVAWQTAWANHETKNGNRISYFRVDTVKHVDHETWQELKTSIAQENPTFKMIGEYYGASINNTGDYLGNGQMDAVLDFDFKNQAASFVNGKLTSVEATLEARNEQLTSNLTTGQFLSSHDEDGFLSTKVDGDTSKAKVAAALQLTAKGIPVIYYGEEIALSGPNAFGDQNNNRYDMQFDNLTAEQKAMLAHYQKLLAARNMYTDVFAAGDRTAVAGSDEDGYLVFKRSTASESVYVALNTTNEEKEVTFSASENDVNYNAYSGEDVEVKDGQVTVTIPASQDGGTVILGAKKQLTAITVDAPDKTAYKNGEELDLTGLVVTGYYGGSRVTIQSDAYQVDASKYNKNVAGTYEIVVSYGGFSKSFNVSVAKAEEKPVDPEQPKEIAPTGVTLSQTEATIERDKELTLTATVAPENATNKSVVFTSDNEKVATVTADGVVKAVAAGEATITATTINGKSATCKVTVIVPATKVFVNQNLKIQKGKALQLTASVLPADSTDKLTWTSSNTGKVTVDANGKLKAVATGSATITVTTDSGKKATCKVTVVKKAVKATKVTIKKTSNTMNVGDVKQLKVTVKPAGTTDVVTFKSSNKKVLSVANNGVVTANKPGKATITAKAGKKTAKITITVKQPATDIALNKTSATLKKGKTLKLKVTLTPKNSTDKVTFKSSKKSVATVNSKGVVTAKKKGTATITVKTSSGKKATCKITVQ